jgi:hypothetical protein
VINVEGIQLRPNQLEFVNRFVQACRTDERVVAAFLGGSNAKGKADQFSDIDLCVITTDSACEDFYNQRESFLQSFGELVFFENFGNPNIAYFIFADGTEGELNFGSEGHLDQIHSGPYRVLLDKRNILTAAVFSEQVADPARQMQELRNNIDWFWHEMSHFITAIGRGKLWWARGQLEALRAKCVNLARLQNNFSDIGVGEEPYFKVENEIDVEKLAFLKTTFCPMEKDAMLESVWLIVRFYQENVAQLCQTYEISYPRNLERVMLERLERLSK